MSSQRGNDKRIRAQKHKNIKAFKNDLHDTSHITKKINNLEFYGLCIRCKDIIDWKVKYKKYKPLTTAKKCVKCLEKKVKHAYYIVCHDCCVNHKVCSKCSKPTEQLEFGESEKEKRRKEDLFQQELKQLTERQRRKFLRLLEKGAFTKENLTDDPSLMKNIGDSEEEDEDFDEDEDFEEEEEEDEDEEEKDLQSDDGDEEYETLDEDEDEEEDFDEEEEEKPKKKVETKSKCHHLSRNKKNSLLKKK